MGQTLDVKEPHDDPGIIRQHRQRPLQIEFLPPAGPIDRRGKLGRAVNLCGRPALGFGPSSARPKDCQRLRNGDPPQPGAKGPIAAIRPHTPDHLHERFLDNLLGFVRRSADPPRQIRDRVCVDPIQAFKRFEISPLRPRELDLVDDRKKARSTFHHPVRMHPRGKRSQVPGGSGSPQW